jgi:hypothetical protein
MLLWGARALKAEAASNFPVGEITSVSRVAVAVRDGKQTELAPGDKVYEFDFILTGHLGGAVVRLGDGTEVEMSADSGIAIVNYVFSPDKALLQLNFERGSSVVRTGGIGLKNPKGLKLVTPRTHINASNADLEITITPVAETLAIRRLPAGPQVLVFGTMSKDLADIRKEGSTVVTDAAGDMTVYLPGELPEEGQEEETD